MEQDYTSSKVKTARLSILSNTALILMKLTAGFVTGSVSILSEAIHSFLDLLASIIAFFSVKISDNPPDERHPYGHGKFENVSGVIEGALIFIAAIWIIYESIEKLLNPSAVSSLGLGFIVMAISGVVNIVISRILYKTARATESIALEADALHLSTDVWTSFGVAAGMLLIWVTGWHVLDPIIAILVALFILKEAFILFRNAFEPLIDTQLDERELEIITACISEQTSTKEMRYHQLRTRRSGPFRYVDVHLEVPGDFSVKASHDICDAIEEDIKGKFRFVEVNIHVEPLEKPVG